MGIIDDATNYVNGQVTPTNIATRVLGNIGAELGANAAPPVGGSVERHIQTSVAGGAGRVAGVAMGLQ